MQISTNGWVPGTRRAIAQWHKAQKSGFMAMAAHWHGRPRAMRFTLHAYSILGLHGRSQRKIKVDPLPFVWSGITKARSQNVRVTATYKGASLYYSLSSLNYRPKGWDHTMREEWETITPNEPDALAQVGVNRVVHTLESLGVYGGVSVERVTW